MEDSIFVAISGTRHYYGTGIFKVGQTIDLVKDPDNTYDEEAIKVDLATVGQVGYIANSVHSVPRGCRSAGRIYDTFEEQIQGIIRFVLNNTVIVELVKGKTERIEKK